METELNLQVTDPTGTASPFSAERFAASLERKGVERDLADKYVAAVGSEYKFFGVSDISSEDLGAIAAELVNDAKRNTADYKTFEFGGLRNNVHNITVFTKFVV